MYNKYMQKEKKVVIGIILVALIIVIVMIIVRNVQKNHDEQLIKQTRENTTLMNTLFTSEEIASHSDAKSCWMSIDGLVYDMGAFVTEHPGGEKGILKLCGKDGTKAFNGVHGGSGQMRKIAELQKFVIGALKQ